MNMNEQEKLRVLIPHWIKHNKEHANEFHRWAKQAGNASDDILSAATLMMQVNESLESALMKLGSPME
jgi:hypothetical protein